MGRQRFSNSKRSKARCQHGVVRIMAWMVLVSASFLAALWSQSVVFAPTPNAWTHWTWSATHKDRLVQEGEDRRVKSPWSLEIGRANGCY